MATRKAKDLTLTAALAQLLQKRILPDLTERAAQPSIQAALQRQHEAEKAAKRTADSLREFVERTLEQVGAAWILSCVFVRTLEERGLLARNRLAGEGAQDSEQLFFELAPSLTARDYLLTVFQEVASLPGAEDVLGVKHNAVFRMSPSNEGARALLDFFRERDATGALRWQFAGDDTRFLGDLYQDLSEQVRKRYALLQTPDFVEEFILDHTLEPAIAECGLEEVRLIDPTCGSGHFLLGAFERILNKRLQKAPGVDVREHALAALGQVYGVDVNPYAVAIARFRLTLAYLKRCGFTQLAQAPKLELNLVVADSLLHGAKDTTMLFAEHESARGDEAAWDAPLFALEEPKAAGRVFGQRYHAVVGNPPYITCKDSALRDAYRELYKSCYREYSLAAPFTERFFQLGVDGGFVGMINANSFMKREFGKALIQQVLPHLDLTRMIDSAGAYIPGHGTPTVLMFGRNRKAVGATVKAVLGKRGEPSTPENAEQGLVWRSIADHGEDVGFENEYVSVAEITRATLNQHPWSLGGGGAADLKELLESRAHVRLGDIVEGIGKAVVTRENSLFLQPRGTSRRWNIDASYSRPALLGEDVRDWTSAPSGEALWPYDEQLHPIEPRSVARCLWPWRWLLSERRAFGKTQVERGLPWCGYSMLFESRVQSSLLGFPLVATHNHFVLLKPGLSVIDSVQVTKLSETASEDDHLALLAYLNSSTACFWMKQACHDKGNRGEGGGFTSESWERFFEFSGTALESAPVPELDSELATFGRELTRLGAERARLLEELARKPEPGASPNDLLVVEGSIRALQERLDWKVYKLFGLLPVDATTPTIGASLAAGERASDVRFAREVLGGSTGERYFSLARLGKPADCASRTDFDDVIATIESSVALRLIETPEYKRTYREGFRPPDLGAFARARLLDALEDRVRTVAYPATLRQLLSASQQGDELDGAQGIAMTDAIPFLAASRFALTGLEKHAAWKRTWVLQRREDLGEQVGDVPVPPKYDSKDYQSPTYWQLRGKLDVPKERFISYPGCQKDGDPSPLIGWAGWNHLQRAQALIALYQERKVEDGWPKERLMPMLVGLHELMFWLELWHSAPEAGSQNPAREFKQYLDAELSTHRLTVSDLEAWRPPSKKAAKAAAKAAAPDAPKAEKKTRKAPGKAALADKSAATEKKPRRSDQE